MSMMLMAQAFKKKLNSPAKKLVLLKLADHANDDGECWPSYGHIADQCEISRRSAMRHIEALCSDGLLVKKSRKGPKGNTSNFYVITLDGDSVTPGGGDTVSPGGDTMTPGGGDTVSPGISHSFESVNESEERTASAAPASASAEPEKPEPQTPKADRLPDCPHMEIIDLWAEAMPDKPQPSKNLWMNTERARHLAARWKAGFTLKHEKTGEPLYHDLESGLDWWRRFFGFLRKSPFLMGDNRWFKLAWVAKKENFIKIMEMDYHDGGDA